MQCDDLTIDLGVIPIVVTDEASLHAAAEYVEKGALVAIRRACIRLVVNRGQSND